MKQNNECDLITIEHNLESKKNLDLIKKEAFIIIMDFIKVINNGLLLIVLKENLSELEFEEIKIDEVKEILKVFTINNFEEFENKLITEPQTYKRLSELLIQIYKKSGECLKNNSECIELANQFNFG